MTHASDRQTLKKVSRNLREAGLADAIRKSHFSIDKRYGIILADPPWRFEPYSRATGMDRAADNHYPTMTIKDILALPVPAARDCILFLWRTGPMLLQALGTLHRWGFAYRTEIVWAKHRMGTGYWVRNQHEVLMVGVRGNPVPPAMGTQWPSVIQARATTHSAKPEEFQLMIEHLWPRTPKLELFARIRRPGWDILYSPEAIPQETSHGEQSLQASLF